MYVSSYTNMSWQRVRISERVLEVQTASQQSSDQSCSWLWVVWVMGPSRHRQQGLGEAHWMVTNWYGLGPAFTSAEPGSFSRGAKMPDFRGSDRRDNNANVWTALPWKSQTSKSALPPTHRSHNLAGEMKTHVQTNVCKWICAVVCACEKTKCSSKM